MNEPQAVGRGRGRAKKDTAEEQAADPLAGGEPADGSDDAPVELDAGLAHQPARQDAGPDDRGQHGEDLDFYPGGRADGWDYDDEAELDADYDEEPDDECDDDEDAEFDPGHGPQPRLAPGHHPGPPHEHGPDPKKAPGKKAPGKKAPGKKAPGPKKHPGHPPPPPHEHGHGHGDGEPVPQPDFG
jgi:hypothetical protein